MGHRGTHGRGELGGRPTLALPVRYGGWAPRGWKGAAGETVLGRDEPPVKGSHLTPARRERLGARRALREGHRASASGRNSHRHHRAVLGVATALVSATMPTWAVQKTLARQPKAVRRRCESGRTRLESVRMAAPHGYEARHADYASGHALVDRATVAFLALAHGRHAASCPRHLPGGRRAGTSALASWRRLPSRRRRWRPTLRRERPGRRYWVRPQPRSHLGIVAVRPTVGSPSGLRRSISRVQALVLSRHSDRHSGASQPSPT